MPLMMLEVLLSLMVCGLAFIAWRITRQLGDRNKSRPSAVQAIISRLATAISSYVGVVRQLFAGKRKVEQEDAEAAAPARMRVLDVSRLAAEGVWTYSDERDDYYERVEQSLEQWFGLYERGRISADTYKGLLESELRRVSSERQVWMQQGSRVRDHNQSAIGEIDQAIAAIRWCIDWVSAQKKPGADSEFTGPVADMENPAVA